MSVTSTSRAAEIRAQLGHPVIDGDGHLIELWPALCDFLRDEGLDPDPDPMVFGAGRQRTAPPTREDRMASREYRGPWWTLPTRNTLDHATATMPGLLAERMEELGIDFAAMFPTGGLMFLDLRDPEARAAACRAYNTYVAELFAPHRDRLVPAALVPMHTPDEALDALDHAVNGLGHRTVLIPSFVHRPIDAARDAVTDHPVVSRYATWRDSYGLDSPHDYDPVWARCVELGVSVSAHSGGMGWGSRASISNYMHNHLGHFGAAGDALCRNLFMGGVTHRHPRLRVALLEGGVAWAVQLLADLIGHWEKRNVGSIGNYDPAELDVEMMRSLVAEYGGPIAGTDLSEYHGSGLTDEARGRDEIDDWVACEIHEPRDIVDAFVPSFFFGCEADDKLAYTAFNTAANPFGARLNAVFSSDIGHWDVPDMRDVLIEAYEQVDEGRMTTDDFRAFTFENPARFFLDSNPDFFAGTAIEREAAPA